LYYSREKSEHNRENLLIAYSEEKILPLLHSASPQTMVEHVPTALVA
jgi:hypothetical protein